MEKNGPRSCSSPPKGAGGPERTGTTPLIQEPTTVAGVIGFSGRGARRSQRVKENKETRTTWRFREGGRPAYVHPRIAEGEERIGSGALTQSGRTTTSTRRGPTGRSQWWLPSAASESEGRGPEGLR